MFRMFNKKVKKVVNDGQPSSDTTRVIALNDNEQVLAKEEIVRNEQEVQWAEMVAESRRRLDEQYHNPLTDEEIGTMFDLLQRASRDERLNHKAKFEDMIYNLTTEYVAANLRICKLRTDKALARSEKVKDKRVEVAE